MISICIPCMNRTHDLKRIMPSLIAAANASPPVEIAILDYNSQDDLKEYMARVIENGQLESGNFCTFRSYTKREYFHMAHARNLSMLMSGGDYLLSSCADIFIKENHLNVIREAIASGASWVHHSDRFVGCICVKRSEFIDAGGYDERFEFYGKEDKDLLARLKRRGLPHARVPDNLSLIKTPWPQKLANYRGNPTRKQVGKLSRAIYEENIMEQVMIANLGKEWGQW